MATRNTSITKYSLALILTTILITTLGTFYQDAEAEDVAVYYYDVLFAGSGKPSITIPLSDIESGLSGPFTAILYTVGGIPKTICYYRDGSSICEAVSIEINSTNLIDLKSRRFELRYSGYLVQSTLYLDKPYREVLTIYSVPLYSFNSFYISICLNSEKQYKTIASLIANYKGNGITSIISSSNGVELYIDDIRSFIYFLNYFSNLAIEMVNTSSTKISIEFSSNRCLNFVLGFGSLERSYLDKNIVELIDHTARSFRNYTNGIPVIIVKSGDVQNMYRLTLYNTLNIVAGDIHSLGGFQLSALTYILSLSSKTPLWLNILNHVKRRALEKQLDWKEIYGLSATLYYLVVSDMWRVYGTDSDIANTTRSVVSALKSYTESKMAGHSYRAVEVSALLDSLHRIEYIVRSLNLTDVAIEVEGIRDILSTMLEGLYRGYAYSPATGEFIDFHNILEALAIASFKPLYSEKHVEYCIKFLDVNRINFNGTSIEWASKAIEALASYGYADYALTLLSVLNSVAPYTESINPPIYEAVFKGFIGVGKTPYHSLSLDPNIPMNMINTSLIIYVDDRPLTIKFIGWGNSIRRILLDELEFPLQKDLPYSMLENIESIYIVMNSPAVSELQITLLASGRPLNNTRVTVMTESGYSTTIFTDDYGIAKTLTPCYEDIWLYVHYHLLGTIALFLKTPKDCSNQNIVMDIPLNSTKSFEEYIAKVASLYTSRVDDIEKEIGVLKMEVKNLSSKVYSLSKPPITESPGNALSKNLENLMLIIFTTIILVIFIAIYIRRRR